TMKQQTRRALEHLLAAPPLPTDETAATRELFVGWAVAVDAALDQLAGAMVHDGYAERVPLERQRCRFDVAHGA
ncbi:MAG: hypothetical protein V3U13_03115, partial [Gemmatimonadota bacterium]